MFKDLYEILEVPSSAKPDEIKKSYKKLVFRYHPDKTSNNKQDAEKFRVVQHAYQILSDTEKRRNYDVDYHSLKSKQTTSRPTATAYTQTQRPHHHKPQPISPRSIITALQGFYERLKVDKTLKSNQPVLYESLADLLNAERLRLLLTYDDTKINREVIELAIKCCAYLDYAYSEKIVARLVKLSGTDNETLQRILKFSRRKKGLIYTISLKRLVQKNYKTILLVLAVVSFVTYRMVSFYVIHPHKKAAVKAVHVSAAPVKKIKPATKPDSSKKTFIVLSPVKANS